MEPKMDLWASFATDPDLEKKTGIVLDYGELGKIRILRAGGANQRYGKRRQFLFAPWERQIRLNLIEEKKFKELLIQLYTETVVIDWENVKGKDGKLLDFTPENVKLVLQIEQLFDDLTKAATDYTLFLEARKPPTDGTAKEITLEFEIPAGDGLEDPTPAPERVSAGASAPASAPAGA